MRWIYNALYYLLCNGETENLWQTKPNSLQNGVLCYYIDREGGVGIDECESFSRAVEVILDKEDIIPSEYSLEVSSPGVDRKLTKEREFLYYLGREVEVKLYAQKDGVKEFDGY